MKTFLLGVVTGYVWAPRAGRQVTSRCSGYRQRRITRCAGGRGHHPGPRSVTALPFD